ncbi:MAG: quinone-dependent dihydroorotate dehydrogenase [Chitinophagaceae bacterium]|nr:quinone-dependent dihydroorotate dehydrogenase [Chitinophagaceae bacterium]
MYRLLRSILFLFPAETVHYLSMDFFKILCSIAFVKRLLFLNFRPRTSKSVVTTICNLQFTNRIGLGAGFDKNAKYLRELEVLGFGFVEIGTVTPKSQVGNKKPRLFRLPKDKTLINRMGFNNDGVEVITERLRNWRRQSTGVRVQKNFAAETPNSRLIIGGNIGKNKDTPNEEAWKDYKICFDSLHPYVDFFVVNVSSPNTPGLRQLQEKEALREILTQLQMQNESFKNKKPIFLKISPDLTWTQIDDVIDLASQIKLDGIVATNTTILREHLETDDEKIQRIGPGGLSGKPLKERSTQIVKYIHQKTNGAIPVIASGGVFTANDAREKYSAGACLIEVWTGFIYEGPSIVKKICRGMEKVQHS